MKGKKEVRKGIKDIEREKAGRKRASFSLLYLPFN